MDWTKRRERARALLAGNKCVHPGSVYDGLSARIAEDLGFELGMFAGSVASLTVLGAPDIAVLTLSEFAGQAYRICRAGDLALVVDADHGYGNALSVRRTVEELETAGVAIMSIEDTQLPAAYGTSKAQLISLEEGVGKMRAALDARQDKKFIISGRTGATNISGLEDAIARGKAYEKAGVDAMFFTGLKTRAQLDAIAAQMKIPLILGSPSAEMADKDYLASRGVKICLQGHMPFMASVQATYNTLKALREGTPPAKLTGVPSEEFIDGFSREADYARWTREFLGGKS